MKLILRLFCKCVAHADNELTASGLGETFVQFMAALLYFRVNLLGLTLQQTLKAEFNYFEYKVLVPSGFTILYSHQSPNIDKLNTHSIL